LFRRSLALAAIALALSCIGAEAKPKPGRHPGPPPQGSRGTRSSAPEFDAKASGAALAFLIGSVLVLTERRRRPAPDRS